MPMRRVAMHRKRSAPDQGIFPVAPTFRRHFSPPSVTMRSLPRAIVKNVASGAAQCQPSASSS